MPVFHDPELYTASPLNEPPNHTRENIDMRRPSNESPKAEQDEEGSDNTELEVFAQENRDVVMKTPENIETSDRGELMERIKRGESPTWKPYGTLEHFFPSHRTSSQQSCSPSREHHGMNQLLSTTELKETKATPQKEDEHNICYDDTARIQRPRSALHSGDFRGQNSPPPQRPSRPMLGLPAQESQWHTDHIGASPATTWYSPSSSPSFNVFALDPRSPSVDSSVDRTFYRPRAPSFRSYSSSLVLKAPTSPLVQQSNNTELDFSPKDDIDCSCTTWIKTTRRYTLPPGFDKSTSTSENDVSGSTQTRPLPMMRQEIAFPYQKHQSRRSLTPCYSLQPASSPFSSPYLRSRKPSVSSEYTPLHHAPMVGSYEESILRGRMATPPSKPLNFMAQIGVLGKGKCKSNLRCPPHVTVPFPAVFYSYDNESGREPSLLEIGPSPYVGLIDLEHSLKPPENSKEEHRRRRHTSPVPETYPETGALSDQSTNITPTPLDRRRAERRRKRSYSPKAPPGGCYRIPQHGQLQIIIKNPNKTAVKLFLVPYDLNDMEPGTKTFLRQRCFSAGPIIEKPIGGNPDMDKDKMEDKQILRYLIHLNICSPSKGRFYLYQSIRVVFANRVPDDKERLRNEIHYPDPRYSIYKPCRERDTSSTPIIGSISSAGAKTTTEKAFQRRSLGFAFNSALENFRIPSFSSMANSPCACVPMSLLDSLEPSVEPTAPSSPLPFQSELPSSRERATVTSPSPSSSPLNLVPTNSPNNTEKMDLEVPSPSRSSFMYPLKKLPTFPVKTTGNYGKLNKGDFGYGGMQRENGESLLARRLRDWDENKNKDNL
ncbi:MAG: hypothetical protein M1834_007405 [Cirrosporium novae-zelandiae]|nr:MAG: hypothetical protein M1834_007405 [Cirrosporium novae-zelandiae]